MFFRSYSFCQRLRVLCTSIVINRHSYVSHIYCSYANAQFEFYEASFEILGYRLVIYIWGYRSRCQYIYLYYKWTPDGES